MIQRSSDLLPIRDKCTSGIINGKASHCNVVKDNNTFINLISDNKILINNAKHLYLRSNCGPDNRTLSGNFLVNFSNCSVLVGGEQFIAKEVINNSTEEIQGAFPNLLITRKILEIHNISTLQQHTMSNRKELKLINLQQYSHGNWIYGILGGLSITSVAITCLIAYICMRKRKIVIKIRHPKVKTINQKTNPSRRTTSNETFIKDEDVLSSPPGGVTEQPDS